MIPLGTIVQVKSEEWFNKNSKNLSFVEGFYVLFTKEMKQFLGKVCVVTSYKQGVYTLSQCGEHHFEESFFDVIQLPNFDKDSSLDYFQDIAETFAVGVPQDNPVTYCALGITGEAGEVSEKIKKIYRDNGGVYSSENKLALAYELGDVLWYVAMMAKYLGFSLTDIASLNVSKLRRRMANNTIHGDGDNR